MRRGTSGAKLKRKSEERGSLCVSVERLYHFEAPVFVVNLLIWSRTRGRFHTIVASAGSSIYRPIDRGKRTRRAPFGLIGSCWEVIDV